MGIIIQYGLFSVELDSAFLQGLIGALIGTGTALLLFLLEGKRIRRNERLTNEEKLKDLFDYFDELIKGIILTIDKQIQAFTDHSQKIRHSPFDFHIVEIQLNQDLERLTSKMDLEKIYHAFLQEKGRSSENKKEFKKLISRIDHAKAIINQAWDSQEKHFERLLRKTEEYKNIAEEEILNQATLFAEQIRNSDPKFEENSFFLEIRKCVNHYYNDQPEPLSIEHLQNEFVTPLKIAMVQNFRHLEPGLYLADKCRSATWLFNEIKIKSKLIADEFDSFSSALQKDYDDINPSSA